jgi:hydroxymethylpyrimidine pyrophosphatase-like HAD family hydrolase
MVIAIDFDGTCVTHDYPFVGYDIGAVLVLKELVAQNHKLILFTRRTDSEHGNFLSDALNWFKIN